MPDKMKFESANLTATNIDKIAELFPAAVTEGKVNFDLLRTILGDDVAGDEAYELTWVGKREAVREVGRPIRKTLRPVVEDETTPSGAGISGNPYCSSGSKDWDTTENLYIEGDNLDVLKLLQESYLGKVKMIYIDPPYNTGNDFVYRDNFTLDKEEYDEQLGIFDEDRDRLFRNTESNGRFHSDWCSMMYPRLVLARNLLRDDGAIFISIDDNEVAKLRKICDEVFGEGNFICQFIWKSKLGIVGTTHTISTTHEYILCYGKHIGSLSFRMIEKENEGRRENLRQWGQADRREDRPSMYYSITIDGIKVYPIKEDGTDGRWRVGRGMADELLQNGLLELVKKGTRFEIYRNFEAGISVIPYDTILPDEIGTTAKGSLLLKELGMNKIFDYSKPFELIRFFSYLCTEKEAIILDFFSGSATTAHAVMQLNAEDGGKRKFIMVQLPEPCAPNSEAAKAGYKNICEIGKERIRRAGEKINAELGMRNAELKDQAQIKFDNSEIAITNSELRIPNYKLDTGFRVLKLDSTNMRDVYYAAGEYTQDLLSLMEDNIKDDRTDMDLLYACLLDWGLPLSMSHKTELLSTNGEVVPNSELRIPSSELFTVHTYNDGDLIACFDKHISDAVVKEIARRRPLRAVFRDSSFASSPEKINVEEIFKLLAPNTSVRVI